MKLEIDNLSCGYNKKAALKNISLKISPGEILCLLGPNGVGKTTFLKTILGFLEPIEGEVRIEGKNIRSWPKKKLARYVGYIPQAHASPFPFSVMDIVLMGRAAHIGNFSKPSAHDYREAEESLDKLGILHLRERIYTELSGGERQMVFIARAISQKTHILLMDEPTSSLDFGNQARVLSQINALASTGLSIIMTTHAPDHSFLCSAQVVLICKKNEPRIGNAEDIVTENNLHGAYGVKVKINESYLDNGTKIHSCIPLLDN
ncbi:ABC transporter ATP-binding protein [uncultured Desulfobacter sp.]|uniref:ABC transporter ATP-binding protein n=1 Tax=uncultured Desulfobacter sp. TaxID=240139 RepID=UPI0029F5333B|nr:ABC transporter ATP-binding protein [uncultured Desulfobacter sp.]